ncbi:hypothetical protein P153DRAFT_434530 [Dothidotthia symphoricarpi CBS 119687]|uniref:Rhodopsin domain-containing protein n=1 Tax=Dothidotthia symphoricarpi CBS 119687 TaxID=1392245 RepID=A0A6A6A416_9PLEO|nr:uncharacterized protein P153DRAFT_434530 [Dothidotthia symphoricarpi CBS 119687]KAF2125488.1 hypothetical protein P153DRAFT_434530 [Dothidotthia symphoricarpi CBS 119687]
MPSTTRCSGAFIHAIIDTCPGLLPRENSGELPSYADVNGGHAIATAVVCLGLVLPALLVRIYTRSCILKRRLLWTEDYFLVISTALLIVYAGLSLKAYTYNISNHDWKMDLVKTATALKYVYAAMCVYGPIIMFAKLAILFQIKRIFLVTLMERNFTYWASWCLIVVNAISYSSVIFLVIFGCNPISKFWTPYGSGKCLRQYTGTLSGVFNLISDLGIWLLPLVEVLKLRHLDNSKMVAVAAVFGMGVLAVVASALRLWQSIKGELTVDTSWNTYPTGAFVANYLISWGGIEAAAVILCGCFPTFPRFFLHVKGLCQAPKELTYVRASEETIGGKRSERAKKIRPTESELRSRYAREESFMGTEFRLDEIALCDSGDVEEQKHVETKTGSVDLTIRTEESTSLDGNAASQIPRSFH